jgi:hypothetical protein
MKAVAPMAAAVSNPNLNIFLSLRLREQNNNPIIRRLLGAQDRSSPRNWAQETL